MNRLGLAVASAAALTLPSVPAFAQDYIGNINPAHTALGQVMPSAIQADAKRRAAARSGRAYRNDDTNAAQTCREVPMYARQLGDGDSRVRRLRAMCREAGYR